MGYPVRRVFTTVKKFKKTDDQLIDEILKRFPDLYEVGYQYKHDKNLDYWIDCHVSVYQTSLTGRDYERKPARRILIRKL